MGAIHKLGARQKRIIPGMTINTGPSDYRPYQTDAARALQGASMGEIRRTDQRGRVTVGKADPPLVEATMRAIGL